MSNDLQQARVIDEKLATKFWSLVNKTDSCWLWTGRTGRRGYGRFSTSRTVTAQAHRLSYELLVGAIPDGLVLDHLCRVTGCVNPEHLEPVTHRENVLRGFGPTAMQARQTHCKRGHEFTPENTWICKKGFRNCRTCIRARNSRRAKEIAECQKCGKTMYRSNIWKHNKTMHP